MEKWKNASVAVKSGIILALVLIVGFIGMKFMSPNLEGTYKGTYKDNGAKIGITLTIKDNQVTGELDGGFFGSLSVEGRVDQKTKTLIIPALNGTFNSDDDGKIPYEIKGDSLEIKEPTSKEVVFTLKRQTQKDDTKKNNE